MSEVPEGERRRSSARMLIGYLAIAAILPYFVLKLLWISGSTVGFNSSTPVDPAFLRGGNIVTAGLEIIGAAIILAFTHSWGQRIPAWLVLAPVWVATGLLAPFIVIGPLVAGAVVSGASTVGDGSLADWVGPLVYLSFGAQAIGIALSFVLYARERWATALTGRVADRAPGSYQPVLMFFTWLGVVLLSIIAIARMSWALGSPIGLSRHALENRGIADQVADAGTAIFAVAAAAGLTALVFRCPRRTPRWIALVLAWVGSGAMFGGSAYELVLLLAGLAGAGTATARTGLVPLVDLVQVIAGTVLATAGAFLLYEMGTKGSPDGREEDESSSPLDPTAVGAQ
ncbi:hypothetical protein ABT218_34840 [Streptomyces sp. NPDC001455]|uniref:hypothetical protein n=1 Tax=unclassified Streptomyces TaxID=2593676 RepID=UPI0033171A2F